MITYILIGISALLSLLCFSNVTLFDRLKMNAYSVMQDRQYYRIISHGFIHADIAHLLINMFVLWSFGTALEEFFAIYFGVWGSLLFLLIYFGGMIVASLPALKNHGDDPYYNAVGASGAVASVLFSYILIFPVSMLGLMLVIPIPAFVFGILYIWYETKMQHRKDGIAHDAHVFGALFGFTLTIVFNPFFIIEFFTQIIEKAQSLF